VTQLIKNLKTAISVLLFTTFALTSVQGVEQSVFPKMSSVDAESLSEKTLILPRDLPGEKTLILIAFARKQQTNIDTWINGMNLKAAKFAWIETPVIDPFYGLFSGFIQRGMRKGIPDAADRERTVTIFTSRADFLKSLGLPDSTDNIYVVVVDRAGNVLAKAEGDYSASKGDSLLEAFVTR
jgi:hypothetical protein